MLPQNGCLFILLQQARRITKELLDELLNEHELIQIQEVKATLLQHLVLIVIHRRQAQRLLRHIKYCIHFAWVFLDRWKHDRGLLRILEIQFEVFASFLAEIDEVALLPTFDYVFVVAGRH